MVFLMLCWYIWLEIWDIENDGSNLWVRANASCRSDVEFHVTGQHWFLLPPMKINFPPWLSFFRGLLKFASTKLLHSASVNAWKPYIPFFQISCLITLFSLISEMVAKLATAVVQHTSKLNSGLVILVIQLKCPSIGYTGFSLCILTEQKHILSYH